MYNTANVYDGSGYELETRENETVIRFPAYSLKSLASCYFKSLPEGMKCESAWTNMTDYKPNGFDTSI